LFDRGALKELLARSGLSKKDKVLTCLAVEPLGAKRIQEIRSIAVEAGLREVTKWNLSAILSNAKSLAIRTPEGWELTGPGRDHVAAAAGPLLPSVSVLVVSALRNQLPSIPNADTQKFVAEAVRCLEAKLYRAAILTSWVGAVAVLYDLVMALHLAAFNAEASKRDAKWRVAKSADDLARMKEFDFLQVLAAIGALGKNVKDELEVCLKLRNGCGHPNSLVVGEHKASAHVETLIQNVFAKF
jgi:hypothetical protein